MVSRFSRWLQGKQRAMTVNELIRALDHEGRSWDVVRDRLAMDETSDGPADERLRGFEARAWRYYMAAAFLRYREECIAAGVADNARFYLPIDEESNETDSS